jgi:hypothetical protein
MKDGIKVLGTDVLSVVLRFLSIREVLITEMALPRLHRHLLTESNMLESAILDRCRILFSPYVKQPHLFALKEAFLRLEHARITQIKIIGAITDGGIDRDSSDLDEPEPGPFDGRNSYSFVNLFNTSQWDVHCTALAAPVLVIGSLSPWRTNEQAVHEGRLRGILESALTLYFTTIEEFHEFASELRLMSTRQLRAMFLDVVDDVHMRAILIRAFEGSSITAAFTFAAIEAMVRESTGVEGRSAPPTVLSLSCTVDPAQAIQWCPAALAAPADSVACIRAFRVRRDGHFTCPLRTAALFVADASSLGPLPAPASPRAVRAEVGVDARFPGGLLSGALDQPEELAALVQSGRLPPLLARTVVPGAGLSLEFAPPPLDALRKMNGGRGRSWELVAWFRFDDQAGELEVSCTRFPFCRSRRNRFT